MGQLSKKLPNVTNGTWSVRMIVGEGKTIPSFVFVSADGEIWQLAHDNQVTICWKCGKQGHIGGRCKEQAVSIEADLVPGVPVDSQGAAPPPVQTWAHVVRGGVGQARGNAEKLAQEQAARVAEERAAAAWLEEQAAAVRLEEQAAAARLVEEQAAAARIADEQAVAARVAKEQAAAARVTEGEAAARVAFEEETDRQRVAEEQVAAARVTEEQAAAARVAKEAAVDGKGAEEAAVDGKGANEAAVDGKDVEKIVGNEASVSVVSILSPEDNILNPAKLSKNDSGAAIPSSSCQSLLGSSPVLHHKGAVKTSDTVEEVLSPFQSTQWGSSCCPEMDTVSMEEN